MIDLRQWHLLKIDYQVLIHLESVFSSELTHSLGFSESSRWLFKMARDQFAHHFASLLAQFSTYSHKHFLNWMSIYKTSRD